MPDNDQKTAVDNICVARGLSAAGYPWSLWYPSWRWAAMGTAEKQAAIDDQAARQNVKITWRFE